MKNVCYVIFMILASCVGKNTQTSKEFSHEAFNAIAEDTPRSDVEAQIGTAFSYYTHVIYRDGAGNNYTEIIDPDPTQSYRIFRYVGVYSRPLRKSLDYRVYEIFYDKNWRVSGRQAYSTD